MQQSPRQSNSHDSDQNSQLRTQLTPQSEPPLNPQSHPHLGIAILLAMSMALGPLAIDTYLPAFPEMAASLGVSIHEISLSISAYVFLLAIGQLVAGPLSDRFGRGIVMLTGLSVFGLASGLISQAESNESLLLMRALQGFGGGWVAVCVPAIVRDRLSGVEAARFFSLIGLIMIIAPGIAPGIGSFILVQFSWPAIFVMLFIYAALLAFFLKGVVFPGRLNKPVYQESISVWQRYRAVLTTRPALRFLFLQTLCFSLILLFISHSSYIYQQYFGVGPTGFSFLFGANIVMMMVANLVNRHLLGRVSPKRILRMSVTIQAVGIVLLILIMLFAPSLWLFLPAMMIIIGSNGAIGPNTQACYMEYFAKNGGTAAALMGATQFSIAGLIAALSALLPQTVLAVILAQGACSFVCMFLVWSRME